jgi:hypothetical protein
MGGFICLGAVRVTSQVVPTPSSCSSGVMLDDICKQMLRRVMLVTDLHKINVSLLMSVARNACIIISSRDLNNLQ